MPVLFSCSHEMIQQDGVGYLSARVYEDSSMEELYPLLKSGAAAPEPVFSLSIYDVFNNQVAYVEDCSTLAAEPLEIRTGTYTAVASSGSGDAAFDAPFYRGSTEFTVEADHVVNIDITATVANTEVTVEYSEEIKSAFESYVFKVTNGLGDLVFSSEDGTDGREGWFGVTGTLSWTLSLVNNDGQAYEDLTGTLEDVKAAQHYRFCWTLGHEPDNIGAGAITVILDDSMNEKEYELVIDPDDTSVPEITEDFEYADIISVEVGENVPRTVSVSSEDGFSSLVITYPGSDGLTKVETELVGASQETIDALAGIGISTSSVSSGTTSASVTLTDFLPSLPIGLYEVSVLAVDNGLSYTEKTYTFDVITDVDAEAVAANAWAVFADVKAKWFAQTQPEGLSFQYRKAADADWTDFSGEIAADAKSRTYTARISGLDPETEYVFRAVSAEDKETKEMTFTTQKEETVPNMSFDAWYQDGEVWYPNSGADNFWWDSANGGTKTLSIYPTTPAEAEYIYAKGDGKNAAKLQSKKATLVGLAAGNIYTGRFIKAVISLTNPGAELDWGVPFTSRPLALTGFYHYLPVTVDQGNYNGMSGKSDIGQVQIMLTDWSSPFRVSTADGQFVNPQTDPGIIAYGTVDLNKTDAYQPFTIELEYRDLSRTPAYIVIVAAASKYGDYFTGGVGSTLYLDEFSFIYDPESLSVPPGMTVE